jgi:hypothetical protein
MWFPPTPNILSTRVMVGVDANTQLQMSEHISERQVCKAHPAVWGRSFSGLSYSLGLSIVEFPCCLSCFLLEFSVGDYRHIWILHDLGHSFLSLCSSLAGFGGLNLSWFHHKSGHSRTTCQHFSPRGATLPHSMCTGIYGRCRHIHFLLLILPLDSHRHSLAEQLSVRYL